MKTTTELLEWTLIRAKAVLAKSEGRPLSQEDETHLQWLQRLRERLKGRMREEIVAPDKKAALRLAVCPRREGGPVEAKLAISLETWARLDSEDSNDAEPWFALQSPLRVNQMGAKR